MSGEHGQRSEALWLAGKGAAKWPTKLFVDTGAEGQHARSAGAAAPSRAPPRSAPPGRPRSRAAGRCAAPLLARRPRRPGSTARPGSRLGSVGPPRSSFGIAVRAGERVEVLEASPYLAQGEFRGLPGQADQLVAEARLRRLLIPGLGLRGGVQLGQGGRPLGPQLGAPDARSGRPSRDPSFPLSGASAPCSATPSRKA